MSGPLTGPANDHLINAIRATTLPFVDMADASIATMEGAETAASCFTGNGRSIWYVFKPSTTAGYRIESNYQSIAVYAAPTLTYGALTEVGCDASQPLSVGVMLQAGTQYAIRISSLSDIYGSPSVQTEHYTRLDAPSHNGQECHPEG